MFFILLGVVLAIGVFFFGVVRDWNHDIVGVICTILVLGGFVLGFTPIAGYEETIKTVELVSLTDGVASTGEGIICYVSVDASNHYTYYTEVESKYAEGSAKAYKSYTVSGNVVIVEDDSYTDAKLIIYKNIPKSNFWTWGGPFESVEYVFYVPTGTVARNISLG